MHTYFEVFFFMDEKKHVVVSERFKASNLKWTLAEPNSLRVVQAKHDTQEKPWKHDCI